MEISDNPELHAILLHYNLPASECFIEPLLSGLINRTYRVTDERDQRRYILQSINLRVFPRPEDVAHNIRRVADYLQEHHPDYLFPAPIRTFGGHELAYLDDGSCYRLLPFVEGSKTIEVVETPDQAYEAARQFGRFTRLLGGLDPGELKVVLPGFHDLETRHRQFEAALETGQTDRRAEASEVIAYLLEQRHLVDEYRQILRNPGFKVRIMHFDAKISNVLFDRRDRGLAVIDLDTIMPGYFFDDVGDMVRTYLSPAGEEERDFSRIYLQEGFFHAVQDGYLSEMADLLTAAERDHFLWAGRFMAYMQALRFLTDYLLGDPYYSTRYEDHNLVRAENQATLYRRL
jgi:aminoglycoside phosphotransferase (APT) family kinase protein